MPRPLRYSLAQERAAIRRERDAVLAAVLQSGRCAICRQKPSGSQRLSRDVVTHTFTEGVRSVQEATWLCRRCLTACRMLRDSAVLAGRLAAHLKATRPHDDRAFEREPDTYQAPKGPKYLRDQEPK